VSGHFAQNTNVSVEKTRAEIETCLTRYGCAAFGYRSSSRAAMIEFAIKERHVRFTLPLPDQNDPRFRRSPAGKVVLSPEKRFKAWEQACRSHWRALLLAIKAKLECVAIGISEFDQEFFAFIVDPLSGRTIYEEVKPTLALRYEGLDKPLLGIPGPQEPEPANA
jgi:hypothetical protein